MSHVYIQPVYPFSRGVEIGTVYPFSVNMPEEKRANIRALRDFDLESVEATYNGAGLIHHGAFNPEPVIFILAMKGRACAVVCDDKYTTRDCFSGGLIERAYKKDPNFVYEIFYNPWKIIREQEAARRQLEQSGVRDEISKELGELPPRDKPTRYVSRARAMSQMLAQLMPNDGKVPAGSSETGEVLS